MTGVVLSQARSGEAKTGRCCAANQDCSHRESFSHGREVSIASSNSIGEVGEDENTSAKLVPPRAILLVRADERRGGNDWVSTSGAVVTGVQTCALPISSLIEWADDAGEDAIS